MFIYENLSCKRRRQTSGSTILVGYVGIQEVDSTESLPQLWVELVTSFRCCNNMCNCREY